METIPKARAEARSVGKSLSIVLAYLRFLDLARQDEV